MMRRSSWRSPACGGHSVDCVSLERDSKRERTEGELPLGRVRGEAVDQERQAQLQPIGRQPRPVPGSDAACVSVDMAAEESERGERQASDEDQNDEGRPGRGNDDHEPIVIGQAPRAQEDEDQEAAEQTHPAVTPWARGALDCAGADKNGHQDDNELDSSQDGEQTSDTSWSEALDAMKRDLDHAQDAADLGECGRPFDAE